MKTKKVVNSKALTDWLEKNGRVGKLKICMAADIDPTMLDKMADDKYPHEVKEYTRKQMLKITKIPESVLFIDKKAG